MKGFKDCLDCAMELQHEYENELRYILDYLKSISPSDCSWFAYGKGFVQVDVDYELVDEYISFFDDLVGCSYTCQNNLNGVTFMVSLSTLSKKY